MKYRSAFSLPETLITIAIIAILGSIIIPIYRSYQIKNDLDLATQQITQMLSRAQLLSQAGSRLGTWGVSVNHGTIFLGDSYDKRNPAFDEIQPLPSSIKVIENNEIIFSPVFGEPSITGEITLQATNGNQKKIPIPKALSGNNTINIGKDIKMKIVFEKVKNKGKNIVEAVSYIGEDAEKYKNNEWIPIKVDGIIYFDSELEKETKGLSIQRENGFVRVLSFAEPESSGEKIINARITFKNATVTKVLNDTGENETENPFDGIVSNEADGDEITWEAGTRSVLFQTRETNGGDAILIYWEADPIRL